MRLREILAWIVLGFASGWFARDLREPPPPPRAPAVQRITVTFPAADTAEVAMLNCTVNLSPRKRTFYTHCTERE